MTPSNILPPMVDPKATKCTECAKPTCNCPKCQAAKGGPHICNRCSGIRRSKMLVVTPGTKV